MWLLLEKFGAKIAAAVGVMIALFLMLKYAKNNGALEQKLEDDSEKHGVELAAVKANAQRTEEVIHNANVAVKTVNAMPASDVDRELQDKWNG